MSHALFDAPGPRGKLLIRVLTVLSVLALLALAVYVYLLLYGSGQLAPSKWRWLSNPDYLRFIVTGLGNTALAALGASVIALPFGLLLALGRLSRRWWWKVPATAIIEAFRSVPVLLVILLFLLVLPTLGVNLPVYWKLVIPVGLGASAVIAEVFRAGVLALPRGQVEAGQSIGLRAGAIFRLIQFPQALRLVVPALVAQFVIVVKETAFGYVVSYPELMQSARVLVEVTSPTSPGGTLLPVYVTVAVIYVLVNVAISQLAQWWDRRRSVRRGFGVRFGLRGHLAGPR